jgi:acetyltransferase-like isoleucine patch superfamily enzyme
MTSPEELIQKALFRSRERASSLLASPIRKLWWLIQGMRVGRGTSLPRIRVTWPHQVSIGSGCVIEDDVFFKFDGIWAPGPAIIIADRCFLGRACEFNIRKQITIGRNALIGSGCKFVDHDHGMLRNSPMNVQQCANAPITLGDDVWLGANVVILKGVTIGNGSIVAAGAIVTKPIGSFEIWAGVPARKVGERPTELSPAPMQC